MTAWVRSRACSLAKMLPPRPLQQEAVRARLQRVVDVLVVLERHLAAQHGDALADAAEAAAGTRSTSGPISASSSTPAILVCSSSRPRSFSVACGAVRAGSS